MVWANVPAALLQTGDVRALPGRENSCKECVKLSRITSGLGVFLRGPPRSLGGGLCKTPLGLAQKGKEALLESTQVLKELAERERRLAEKVAAARTEAEKIVADAEVKAKSLLADAEAAAHKLAGEYGSKRETEEKSILETAMVATKGASEAAKQAAESKISEAVKLIVSKVLP